MGQWRIIRRIGTYSGFRDDLGIYVRSRWEANIGRYLNFLKDKKQIKDWKYEAQVFTFPVERGNKFYRPDFMIINNNDSIEYYEVKGYMDNNSRIKLDRMARYYPNVKIIIIDAPVYKSISHIKNLIKNWE